MEKFTKEEALVELEKYKAELLYLSIVSMLDLPKRITYTDHKDSDITVKALLIILESSIKELVTYCEKGIININKQFEQTNLYS